MQAASADSPAGIEMELFLCVLEKLLVVDLAWHPRDQQLHEGMVVWKVPRPLHDHPAGPQPKGIQGHEDKSSRKSSTSLHMAQCLYA